MYTIMDLDKKFLIIFNLAELVLQLPKPYSHQQNDSRFNPTTTETS